MQGKVHKSLLGRMVMVVMTMICAIASNAHLAQAATTINFDDLGHGVVVTNQYSALGVTFSGTTTYSQPNYNDAYYPPHSTPTVVSQTAGSVMRADFSSPQQNVSAYITSSGVFVLEAYDANDQLVGSVQTAGNNTTGNDPGPNILLQVNSASSNITYVIFNGVNDQFSVDDVTFDGLAANTAPVASDGTATTDEDTATTIDLKELVMDAESADGDLTYSIVAQPADGEGSVTLGDNGIATYTPPANFNGTTFFTYKASDGALGSETKKVTITVNSVEDPPTLGGDISITGNEGQLITFFANGGDPDSDSTLTYSLIGAPTGATINSSTGEFRWIPTEAQAPGTYTFQIKVTDGTSSAFQNVTIVVREVNSAPSLELGGNRTVTGGVPFSFGISASDPDIPQQGMGVAPIAPTPNWIGLTNGPTIYGTAPVSASPYTVTIAIRAGDSFGANTDKSIQLTVNPAPVTASVTWTVQPTFNATEGTLTYRLKNTTSKAIAGVYVLGQMRVPPKSVVGSVGNTSWNNQGNGYYGVTWTGFNVAPGGEATLTIKVPRPASGRRVAETLYCSFGPGSQPTLSTPGINAP